MASMACNTGMIHREGTKMFTSYVPTGLLDPSTKASATGCINDSATQYTFDSSEKCTTGTENKALKVNKAIKKAKERMRKLNHRISMNQPRPPPKLRQLTPDSD
jgi:hypothetical protein